MRVERVVAPIAGLRLLRSIVVIVLGFGHLYEMMNFGYHTHYRGGVLFDYSMVHFLETEGVESAFLHCGTVDAALYLFDFNLCHCVVG